MYLASSEEVAIGEVRPQPGQYVSIGCFVNDSPLKLADLRFLNLFDSFDDEAKLKKFLFLKDIAEDLSVPVVPDKQEHYLITQFISDIIRDLGYDVIVSIGELEENNIGSNCGQYILSHLNTNKIESAYTYPITVP